MHPVERDGRDRQGGKAKTGENDQAGDQGGLCEQIADHGDLRIPSGSATGFEPCEPWNAFD
jgi:hypothetical protein